MMDFYNYYLNYLNVTRDDVDNEKTIFKSKQRDIPINNYYFHYLIVTNIENKEVFSISPRFYDEFIHVKHIDAEEIRKFFDKKLKDYSSRVMYRMTIEENTFKSVERDNKVQRLTEEILMKNLKGRSKKEIEDIWKRKEKEILEGREFVILNDDKIISYCKISNIDYNGGNLTVWTNPKYRGYGYGKQVTIAATKWCFDNNIIPIYLVHNENLASLNLAKSIGFKILSKEFIISKEA